MKSHYLSRLIPQRQKLLILLVMLVFVVFFSRACLLMAFSQSTEFMGASTFHVGERMERRGNIYDRNNEILAQSQLVYDAILNPMEIVSKNKVVFEFITDRLANWFSVDPANLRQKIISKSKAGSQYYPIKKNLFPVQKEELENRGRMTGLTFKKHYKRFYTEGEVNAHLLGITDSADIGQEGLELLFDSLLSGKSDKRVSNLSASSSGKSINVVDAEKKDGNSLVLSIDSNIQYVAYKELKNAMERHDAKGAGAIVVDAKTGEILALVNQPGFNPNAKGFDFKTQRNRVYTDSMPPGSTIKPLVAAMALNEGGITADTTFDIESNLRVGNHVVNDPYVHGKITVTIRDILKKSSNVGIVTVAQTLSKKQIFQYMDSLGFLDPSQQGFPGEASSVITPLSDWTETKKSVMAYGYGINVNLIQLVRAYLVLANDGFFLAETLLKLDAPPKNSKVKSIFKPGVAREVRKMMTAVTEEGGTGFRAAMADYHVAGKTGTTRKLIGQSYDKNRHVTMFAGMAPASNPDMVMAVWIDEPQRGGTSGGAVAAPVFKNIMQDALRYRGVLPDKREKVVFYE